MRISVCVTTAAADLRCHHQQGFTLLEILIVVVLMAGISTLMVVAALRVGDSDPVAATQGELQDVITMLTERSLFTGEVLALRFSPQGWEPLRFDVTAADFLPLPAPFRPVTLPDGLTLDWQLEQHRDRSHLDIASVAANLLERESVMLEKDKPEPPQMFFFPSGEVSPLTLWLGETGAASREIHVDALGAITSPQQDDEL